MKRFFAVLTVIALVLCTAVFALSCGNKPEDGGEIVPGDTAITTDGVAGSEDPSAPATELPEGVTADPNAPVTEAPADVTADPAAPASEQPGSTGEASAPGGKETAAPGATSEPFATLAPGGSSGGDKTNAPGTTPAPGGNVTPAPGETDFPGLTEGDGGEDGPGIIDNGDGTVTIVVPSGQSSGGIGGNP